MLHVMTNTTRTEIRKSSRTAWDKVDFRTVIRSDIISFLRYDDEHHRLGITRSKTIVGKSNPEAVGLEHVCFTYGSLAELALAYKQRKAKGFLPIWCVNRGPGTS